MGDLNDILSILGEVDLLFLRVMELSMLMLFSSFSMFYKDLRIWIRKSVRLCF